VSARVGRGRPEGKGPSNRDSPAAPSAGGGESVPGVWPAPAPRRRPSAGHRWPFRFTVASPLEGAFALGTSGDRAIPGPFQVAEARSEVPPAVQVQPGNGVHPVCGARAMASFEPLPVGWVPPAPPCRGPGGKKWPPTQAQRPPAYPHLGEPRRPATNTEEKKKPSTQHQNFSFER